jgi:dTDP-glucose pyrophosphorylase
MTSYKDHLISTKSNIREALKKLDILGKDAILFVVDENKILIGALTDGDVRRGLLNNINIDCLVTKILQENPKFIRKGELNLVKLIKYRQENYKIIPIVDKENKLIDVINFRLKRSYLSVDAVIMAGGKGTRLIPLTLSTPKPLLKVGDKPIMEHNLDHLSSYGINNYWFSVNYLGDQIENYFKNGAQKNISINYVWENNPLGTIGAVSKIKDFKNDYILITNSDILTNLNYERFFLDFLNQDADFSVVTVPYNVSIPYAVLETESNNVKSFIEKPKYTYYSNGGIYLIKKSILKYIPKNEFFNATDLMELMIKKNKKIISFPLSDYWLDVGNHEDFNKAKEDIYKIKF